MFVYDKLPPLSNKFLVPLSVRFSRVGLYIWDLVPLSKSQKETGHGSNWLQGTTRNLVIECHNTWVAPWIRVKIWQRNISESYKTR